MILLHDSNEYNFLSYRSAHFCILQHAVLVGMLVPIVILLHDSNEYNFSSYCSAHFDILQLAVLVGMQWPCK